MIFSVSQPKSQSYRTALFEAIQTSKQILNNTRFKKDDFKQLTKQIYNKGVDISSNNINMTNNFSHKDYLRKPAMPTTSIQEVHKTIAQKAQAAEAIKKAQTAAEAIKKAQVEEAAKKARTAAEAIKKAQVEEAAKKAQVEKPAQKKTEFENRALAIFPSTDYPDFSYKSYTNENNKTEKKLLVLYVYHIYNDRVKHFIHNCIFYHENVDFIIIANTNRYENTHIVSVPNKKNIKMLFRKNIGYDFGGWSDALLLNNLYENYDNFIFANSSVIGPFLNPDFKGKWTDIYINGLKNNVKLFGSTINTLGESNVEKYAHVQSYIFSMDKITLKYLIKCSIFSMTNYAKTFESAIHHKEILMSRKIIKNNWNIGSLLKYYENIDFTFNTKKRDEYKITFLDDIMYSKYKNKLWNEYEVVFIKGNRINQSFDLKKNIKQKL
jgi:hypothetical protein